MRTNRTPRPAAAGRGRARCSGSCGLGGEQAKCRSARRGVDMPAYARESFWAFRPAMPTQHLIVCSKLSSDVVGLSDLRSPGCVLPALSCDGICLLSSQARFKEPVIAADNVTYERAAIERHLLAQGGTILTARSPMTGLLLPTLALRPNMAIKRLLEADA